MSYSMQVGQREPVSAERALELLDAAIRDAVTAGWRGRLLFTVTPEFYGVVEDELIASGGVVSLDTAEGSYMFAPGTASAAPRDAGVVMVYRAVPMVYGERNRCLWAGTGE